jgi:hypothetical protein
MTSRSDGDSEPQNVPDGAPVMAGRPSGPPLANDETASPRGDTSIPDEASWAMVRALGQGGGLSTCGHAATAWAVETLERLLGPSWPRRQHQKYQGLPGSLLAFSSYRHELPKFLALAINLERYASEPSFQPVLQNLKRGTDAATWRHTLLQMEVARAGQAFGARPRFEPAIDGSPNSADVELALDQEAIIVETVSLRRPQSDLDAEQFERTVQQELDIIGLTSGVSVDAVIRYQAEEDLKAWLAGVHQRARMVRRTGCAVACDDGWITLHLRPETAAVGSGLMRFYGAIHVRDGWRRIQTTLRGKAGQSASCDDVWIRLDAVDGLFSLTDWAREPFEHRAQRITAAVRNSLHDAHHVAGVVVSSGASVNFDSPDDPALTKTATAPGGSWFLRRLIAPGLLRETAIIPLRQRSVETGQLWTQAYDAEHLWLEDDLRAAGLPPLAKMWRDTAPPMG